MKLFLCAVLVATYSYQSLANSAHKYDDILHGFREYRDRCTSIAVGKSAMLDGSTITTHTNDCQECDLRITHVPARDWPAGSKRPIHDIRSMYPRYSEAPEENVHGPDYLIDKVDKSIYNWTVREPFYWIDQVPHTYAYTLGAYGIQNEKQVSMGESTCSSVFTSKPYFAPGGKSIMHLETMTEIALERCDSARCAVQLMGDLAVKYGFYGPEWDGPREVAQDEAGEALTVSDPSEVWMFHVMPDDSGTSAIWVAQRVPDDHIAVVANQFVIGEIDLADKKNFLGSDNVHEVAVRNKLWDPKSGQPFNFQLTYGTDRHSQGFGCTRRVWRVMTLAAPSLLPIFSAYTDGRGTFGFGENGKQPYPFSVKPDKPLTVRDIMRMNRDQYEGTDFDMTKGVDAGPFGDSMRYPPSSKVRDPENGIDTAENAESLGFGRPVSLWRTAYATITQSRKSLPDLVGAVTWIAPYAPHHSTFVPVYASAKLAPSSLNTGAGTQYKLEKKSNWWVHCLTSNYISKWYKYTIQEVNNFQSGIEEDLLKRSREMEQQVVGMIQTASIATSIATSEQLGVATDKFDAAKDVITAFHDSAAAQVRDQWWDFFFHMAGKYRDVYIIADPHVKDFTAAYKYLSVSKGWLELIGYWGVPGTPPSNQAPVPVRPINVPSADSPEIFAEQYPSGFYQNYKFPSIFQNDAVPSTDSGNESSRGSSTSAIIVAVLVGAMVGVLGTMFVVKRNGGHQYSPIP